MMSTLDTNGDGEVDFAEFWEWFGGFGANESDARGSSGGGGGGIQARLLKSRLFRRLIARQQREAEARAAREEYRESYRCISLVVDEMDDAYAGGMVTNIRKTIDLRWPSKASPAEAARFTEAEAWQRAESARVMRDRWLRALRWLHRESAHRRVWKEAKRLISREAAAVRVALRGLIASEVLNTAMSRSIAHDSLVAALAAPADIVAAAEAAAAEAAAAEAAAAENVVSTLDPTLDPVVSIGAGCEGDEGDEQGARESESAARAATAEVELVSTLNPIQRLRRLTMDPSAPAAAAAVDTSVVNPIQRMRRASAMARIGGGDEAPHVAGRGGDQCYDGALDPIQRLRRLTLDPTLNRASAPLDL